MPRAAFRSCFFALAFVAVTFLTAVSSYAQPTTYSSPEGKTKLDVETDSAAFAVEYGDLAVRLSLGLTFRDAPRWGSVELVETTTRDVVDIWHGIGRKSEYCGRCVEATFTVREKDPPNRKLDYVFRLYDEGVAFRYVIRDDSGVFDENGEFCVESEDSVFTFDQNYEVWGAWFKDYASNHEGNFQKKKLSDVKEDSFIGRPLLVRGERFVAALTESDLLDWSGLQFAGTGKPNEVRTLLAPRDDKRGCVVRKGACASPWRVMILAETPAELINCSDIVLNLASPCAFNDSWVKPGNSAWDWWAPKGGRKITNEAYREFIDFASEMKWDYLLIDAGWYKGSGKNLAIGPEGLVVGQSVDVPALVEYGKAKGVRILLWIDWPDIVQVDVRKTLKRVADWGVAGVKIDHMNSHSQETVAALTEAVRIAAEYKLLVNFHGMYEPTGLERTFPNQITREGIRGNEYFRGSALSPSFVATLPYTRCLIGPGDYTPGGFRDAHLETYKPLREQTESDASTMVVGTRAHELALCAVLDSPLRCLCDLPRVYRGQKGLEYLVGLPATWDDTIALDGEIGEFYAVARRSGSNWLVSAITNEKARTLDLTLDFLDDGAEYDATFYRDAPESDQDANAIEITRGAVRKGDAIQAAMVRDGGWNAVFVKK
ncbi:MAG: glycoside hydrolase family 97 catalytic domain-containing protein [Thermoguttaceae bacterium]|nr:glycoside hydrolase family 97 catalytic domain-containing protein [Thermoguttaceae bacterium]